MPAASAARRRTFNATDAKNRFGAILKIVHQDQPVFIEKHGVALAVVLDIDSYNTLVDKARGSHEVQLDALRQQFEVLYARMQLPSTRKATDALFEASPAKLARTSARRLTGRG